MIYLIIALYVILVNVEGTPACSLSNSVCWGKGISWTISMRGSRFSYPFAPILSSSLKRNSDLRPHSFHWSNSDLGTLASEIKDEKMFDDKNVVKVSTKNKLKNNNFIKALDFSRKYSLNKNLNIYHHIGIYCYKISILKKIVNLDQSKDEIKNNLEQLRAISNGIEISVALAKKSSIGVDTEEDYVAIKKIMEYKS